MATGLARKWWRVFTGVCLVVTGAPLLVACYGPPYITSEPHDPTLSLTDFSYEPSSPVLGDALVFRVTANKATTAGEVSVSIGDWDPLSSLAPPFWHRVALNDWGIGQDVAAGDGVFTGSLEWRADYGTQANLPVLARLLWDDGAEPLELAGLPLTIIANGEEL